ncbi:MAG: family 10 glycosylhydrolase [Oscillospiraceae bacterium]|jgi:uncharacterized lipoprotein YddW (UPF0748 family)|nr:family 10 glycosylhydrolase [Oscillospiraceae bacterium]
MLRRLFSKFFPIILTTTALLMSLCFFVYRKINSKENENIKTQSPIITADKISNENTSYIENNSQEEQEAENNSETKTTSNDDEMRAVWVPFTSLDLSSSDKQKDEQGFKELFDKIIKESKKRNMNTLIVHVRPFGDAMYPSKFFPWSHLLTGKQGQNPGYDPLEYMVKATHKAGLKIHAWINPFRIQIEKTPNEISDDNPYCMWTKSGDKKFTSAVVDWNEKKFYNPASSEARKLILNGIREIVNNYKIDGIHFDDYFYPNDENDISKENYEEYCKSMGENSTPISFSEFKKNNINELISGTSNIVKGCKPSIPFGISVACDPNYNATIGADVETWGSMPGYIDYLCPQIYMSFKHNTLPFDKMAEKWRNLVSEKSIKFYLGLGVYKAGNKTVDGGTWNEKSILSKEIEFGRKINCDGFMLFSFDSFLEKQSEEEVASVSKMFN